MAGSSNLRPMRRLEAKTVFSGLVTAYIYNNKIRNFLKQWSECKLTCLLAGIPTSLCPSSVKATVEGVVLTPIRQRSDQYEGQGIAEECSNYLPSAFSMTRGLFPSMIATHELVVPRSIPITLYVKRLFI